VKLNLKTETECSITNPEEVLKSILEYYMPYNQIGFRNGYKVEGGVLYVNLSDGYDSKLIWGKKRDLTRKEVLMWELLGELCEAGH